MDAQCNETQNDSFHWEYKVVSVFVTDNDESCSYVTKIINEGGWEPYMTETYPSSKDWKPSCLLVLRRKVDFVEDAVNFGPSD